MSNSECYYVQALYDFETQESNEITFKLGDILQVLYRINDDWFYGRLASYDVENPPNILYGNFPSNFVKKVDIKATNLANNETLFLSVHDFPLIEKQDLDFFKNELIIGKKKIDENWWHGCYLNNKSKCGIFPISHVRKVQLDSRNSSNNSLINDNLTNRSSSDSSSSSNYETLNRSDSDTKILYATVTNNADSSNMPKLNLNNLDYLDATIGDHIFNVHEIDSYWVEGENIYGKKGIIPKNCVIYQNNHYENLNDMSITNDKTNSILNRTQRNIYMNFNNSSNYENMSDHEPNESSDETIENTESSDELYEHYIESFSLNTLQRLDSLEEENHSTLKNLESSNWSNSDTKYKKTYENEKKNYLELPSYETHSQYDDESIYEEIHVDQSNNLCIHNSNSADQITDSKKRFDKIKNELEATLKNKSLNRRASMPNFNDKPNEAKTQMNDNYLNASFATKNKLVSVQPNIVNRPALPPKPEYLKNRRYSQAITSDDKSAAEINSLISKINELKQSIATEENKILNTNEENNEDKKKLKALKETFDTLTDKFLKLYPNHEFKKQIFEWNKASTLSIKEETIDVENKSEDESERDKNKRITKRKHIIEEIVNTEKVYYYYINSLYNIFMDKSTEATRPAGFNPTPLLGKLIGIAKVSELMIELFDKEITKNDDEIMIGECLLTIVDKIKSAYTLFIRDLDTDLAHKYQSNKEINDYMESKLQELNAYGKPVKGIDNYLIKPIQRISLYALLIEGILKNTPTTHKDYLNLQKAHELYKEIGLFVNKRRSEIVLKYRNRDDNRTIFEKVNLNTLKKKSARLGMKVSSFLGLYEETVDVNFVQAEESFRQIESIITHLLIDSKNFMFHFKDMLLLQIHIVEDLAKIYENTEFMDLINDLKISFYKFLALDYEEFTTKILERVRAPLENLILRFKGTNKLIEKRRDKLLDYDRVKSDIAKIRINERTREMNKTLQTAQKDYEDLNLFLLDELPILTYKSFKIFALCTKTFIDSFRSLLENYKEELKSFKRPNEQPVIPLETMNMFLNQFLRFHTKNKENSKSSFYTETISPKIDVRKVDERFEKLKKKYGFEKLYVANNYHAANQKIGHLAANAGDIFAVVKMQDFSGDESIWACDNNEQIGFLPANILIKLTDEKTSTNSLHQSDNQSLTETKNNTNQQLCEALYDFNAISSNMLSIKSKDLLLIIEKCDENGNGDWWLVENSIGKRGYVPYNYVRLFD